MTGRDPLMPPDLDRLLANATVPAMSAGLIDRIVAEAARPGRTALPVARPPRSRGRQWTRRGVWSGIVAVNLMLATAVAAAFGGGALTFARIATVARHVVEHIRAPFHHAEPRTRPARPVVVHRLAVPAAAILTAPRVPMPMTAPRVAMPLSAPRVPMPLSAPRSLARTPPGGRPQPARLAQRPVSGQPIRPVAVDHAHAPLRAGPYAIRHAAPRERFHARLAAGLHDRAAHRGGDTPGRPRRDRLAEPHGPKASPIIPYGNPAPRAEEAAGREPTAAARGLQGEGGRRFDGPRWQAPATAAAGTDARADDRPGWQGQAQGQDRSPGWRRRLQGGNPGATAPGWRRRAGFNGGGGGGRPGGRMKPPRPGGGGRRPRRF